MKHLLKKHRMLSVGIFLAAVLSIIYAAILSPAGKSTGSFSEFCTTLFREEMKSNTMNLHFTLKDPKAAGIDSYEITLGSLSGDSHSEPLLHDGPPLREAVSRSGEAWRWIGVLFSYGQWVPYRPIR